MLAAHADEAGSGIVTAGRGKLRHLFCLQEGWLVHAASNLIEEQLGAMLAKRGVLDEPARVAAESAASERGVKLAQVLLEQGTVGDADLRSGIEALVEEILASTLDWAGGELEWSAGRPRLDGEVTVRLDAAAMLFRYAGRRVPSGDGLRLRIGPPDVQLEAKAPRASSRPPELDATCRFLLECCDGSRPLPEVLRLSPADEETTLRAVYGLLLLGYVEPVSKKQNRPAEARVAEPALTREECLERLSLGEGRDHYTVLGIDREAGVDRVREAYYALARRYHPDRFRSGSLKTLLPRFERFFTIVTDAYNTLSSADLRIEYDQQLFSTSREKATPKEADTTHLARENYARARILLERRRHLEAATFLENAVQLDGSNADYHRELGILLARSGRRRDEAVSHLERSIELSPTSVPAYVALAHLYHRLQRIVEASRAAHNALRWDPANEEAKALLAEIGEKKDSPSDGGILRGLFRG
jgi:tetratricopeptide (TPR) repeat protein